MYLKDLIAERAKDELGIADVMQFLKVKYWDEGLSLIEIGQLFTRDRGGDFGSCSYSSDAVRVIMVKYKIPLRAPNKGIRFHSRIADVGYADAEAYFSARDGGLLQDMASELGAHLGTVTYHYNKWQAQLLKDLRG